MQVVAAQWNSARDLIELLEVRLVVDWLGIRPPGLAQFSCIGRGMVTLFVQVKQSHTEAMSIRSTTQGGGGDKRCIHNYIIYIKCDLYQMSVFDHAVLSCWIELNMTRVL